MSYEIEIKAHLQESETEQVRQCLSEKCGAVFLGEIDKEDIYWHRDGEDFPVLRTRLENDNNNRQVLFTAKPLKEKSESGTEKNQEFEIYVSASQWNDCLEFCKATGLEVFRRKWKRGWHYKVQIDGFSVHAEILDVRFLGWFIELEICPEDIEKTDVNCADSALRRILSLCGLEEKRIEKKGYNSMLVAVSHEKG